MNIKYRIIVKAGLLAILAFSATKIFASTDTWVAEGDGTVIDVATGLIWQQQDDGIGRTHAEAITYCQSLDLADVSDWRLPNIKELASIFDFRHDEPAIDSVAFPNTGQSYWSATSNASNTGAAWIGFFFSGAVLSNSKADDFIFSRCVR